VKLSNDTTVSVLMVTYKHEAYIAEAIEGVLIQEVDFPIELIIADDCSPDGTAEIVQKYISEHPKGHWIKYTRHETNKGMMPNFVWALEQARGEFIALCEGDDYWTDSNKLSKQIQILRLNTEYAFVFTNAFIQNEFNSKEELLKEVDSREFSLEEFVLFDYHFPHCTKLMRKGSIDFPLPNWVENILYADYMFHIFNLQENRKGYYLNEITSVYRIHQHGVISLQSKKNKIDNGILFIVSMMNYLHSKKAIVKFKTKLAELYAASALLHLKRLHFLRCIKYIFLTYKTNSSFSIKDWRDARYFN